MLEYTSGEVKDTAGEVKDTVGEVEDTAREVKDTAGEVEDTAVEVKVVLTAREFRCLLDKRNNTRMVSVHGHSSHGMTTVTGCLLEKVRHTLSLKWV